MLFPLWRSLVEGESAIAPSAGAPLVLMLLVAFCFVALALEASSGGLGARTVAALGVLVAINSLLRLIEVAVPGPGGFTPVFFLIILAGYVFGARFGFLMGAMTMAVSAVVTGGVGPWLPYQMLAAGWVGLTSGWLPGGGRDRSQPTRSEIAVLAVFGAAWGFGFGLLMTPWSWGYFHVGASGEATLDRFMSFYVATSMVWDAFAATGTALLMVVAGAPVLGALRRMGRWFDFHHEIGADDAASEADELAEWSRDVEMSRPSISTAGAKGTEVANHAATPAIHPYAWIAWAAGVVTLASATRNPVVLLCAALAVGVVFRATPAPGRDFGISVGRIALFVIPIAALYNVASAHYGATVLFRLPAGIPLIGGPWTLESLVYGIAIGLSLVVLIGAFATVARAVPVRALVSLVPRAFGALSLTGSIALAYLPSARDQMAEVREAQAVRGHRNRGVRSWLPLVLPLLIGGLERSVTLAESLTARGLAPPDRPAKPMLRLGVPLGLSLVMAGWLGAVTGLMSNAPVVVLAASGVVVSGLSLFELNRRTRRTAYRRDRARAADLLVAVAAWAPLLVAWLTVDGRVVLDHSPLPSFTLSPMEPVFALSLLGLLLPAAVLGQRHDRAEATRDVSVVEGQPSAGIVIASTTGASSPVSRAVEFSSFGYSYPDAETLALEDVTFSAVPAGLTLVTGESGSGKSTLLRTVNGLVPHFTGGALRGSVRVWGRDPVRVGPGAMGDVVGFVSGDPERTFVMDTVADEVAFALEYRGLSRQEMAERIDWSLHQVSLRGFGERDITTLSGGERQRVAVAAALATRPRVLVLDEPTSQVDDITAEGMTDAIAALIHDEGLAVLVSEHRLDRLVAHASRRVRLQGGRARAVDGTGIDKARAASLTRKLQRAPRVPGKPLLRCDELRLRHGDREVLRGATLDLREGEIVALMGASGSGKTTMLRLAVGLLQPDSGRVSVDGVSIAGREVADVCRQVGYLPQDPNALLFAQTVRDELSITLANHGQDTGPGSAVAIDRMLDDLGILDLSNRYPRDLSTGQRQRVALATIAVTRPAALLLDEPTRGLDGASMVDLANALHSLASDGVGVLVATHDRRLASAAHRVVRLDAGVVHDSEVPSWPGTGTDPDNG